MKEALREWLRKWLDVPTIFADGEGHVWISKEHLLNGSPLKDRMAELEARVEDLEEAYPDYKKAKAKADDEKANEIVPGFTPFTQRKRQWEATRRRPQKKS